MQCFTAYRVYVSTVRGREGEKCYTCRWRREEISVEYAAAVMAWPFSARPSLLASRLPASARAAHPQNHYSHCSAGTHSKTGLHVSNSMR